MKYLFLIFIILNPIFFWTDHDQRMSQELFFQLSSVLIFASSLFVRQKEIKFSKLHLWLGIMLIAFVGAWLKSMNGWWKIGLNYLLGLLVYFSFIKTMSKDDIKFLFKGVTWVGIAALIYMTFQYFGVDLRGSVNDGSHGRIDTYSFFLQNSAMGMYFAQIIPIIASINIYLAPLLFIPVVISQCVGAIVGGVVAYLFYLWFRKRILFWIFLIPVVIGALCFGLTKENFDGLGYRLPVWQETFKEITQNPLGQGLDSFYNGKQRFFQDIGTKTVYRAIRQGDEYKYFGNDDFMKKLREGKANVHSIEHPHNEYLWFGYEVGLHSWVILGFIFYYLYDRFRKSRRDILTCAVFSYLIALAIFSLTQFNLSLPRLTHLLPIMLGCFYLTTEEEKWTRGM